MEIQQPTGAGIGDGRAAYFFYGFDRSCPSDRVMYDDEMPYIRRYMDTLRAHGYTTVFDDQVDRFALRAACYGKNEKLPETSTAAIYWSGHGSRKGHLATPSGLWIKPSDIKPEWVQQDIRFAVFSSCHTGSHRRIWQDVFGDETFLVAWARVLFHHEAMDFIVPEATPGELDHLIQHFLIEDGDGTSVPNLSEPEDWVDDDFDEEAQVFFADAEEDEYWESICSVSVSVSIQSTSTTIRRRRTFHLQDAAIDLSGGSLFDPMPPSQGGVRTISGIVREDIHLQPDERLDVTGIVTGDIHGRPGCRIQLHGTLTGNIYLQGGELEINGVMSGNVHRGGGRVLCSGIHTGRVLE